MGQKYKIFYRRHHFVFDVNHTDSEPFVVINQFDVELITSLLSYLKTCTKPQVILIKQPDGFNLMLKSFKVISAAGGAVFNTDGELLIMKRKGLWDLPKGKLDKGESIEKAAVREVEEECNVFDIKLKKKLAVTYHLYFEKRWLLKETHWFKMKTNKWEDATPQVEEEIEKIKWVKLNKLDLDKLDTYNNIRYVIRQL
jgi:8-oxo-dGTP pyrophosphatase MutT (NUDIX family)